MIEKKIFFAASFFAVFLIINVAGGASCDNVDGTQSSTYLSCEPKVLSVNHPSVSTDSSIGCINGLDLQKATDLCRDADDCTGFWLYENGRFCPKATFNNDFSRVIAAGSFYSCEKKRTDVTTSTFVKRTCPDATAVGAHQACRTTDTDRCRYYLNPMRKNGITTCSQWCAAKSMTCSNMQDDIGNSCNFKSSHPCDFSGDATDSDWICECDPGDTIAPRILKEQGLCRESGTYGGYCVKLNVLSPTECYAFLEESWPSSLVVAEWRTSTKQCALLQLATEKPSTCPLGFTSRLDGGTGNTGPTKTKYVGDGNLDNVCWQPESKSSAPTANSQATLPASISVTNIESGKAFTVTWDMKIASLNQDTIETVVNGDMVGGTAIAHESGSYSTGGCTPGVTTCGIRSITAASNTGCSASSIANNKCPCPVDVAARNGGKCGVLKFESTGGAGSEYEIHNRPGNMGYAGVVRVGAWIKCKGGWDGDRVIIHSRFYGGDSKNEVLGASDGPWKLMNADCKATGGVENVWEWVSFDFDSGEKVIDHYSVYIGYPQKSTKGDVSVAGVSVKPLTWEPRSDKLEQIPIISSGDQCRDAFGESEQYSACLPGGENINGFYYIFPEVKKYKGYGIHQNKEYFAVRMSPLHYSKYGSTRADGHYGIPKAQKGAACAAFGANVGTLAEMTFFNQNGAAEWCACSYVADKAIAYYPMQPGSSGTGCGGSSGGVRSCGSYSVVANMADVFCVRSSKGVPTTIKGTHANKCWCNARKCPHGWSRREHEPPPPAIGSICTKDGSSTEHCDLGYCADTNPQPNDYAK